VLPEQELGSGDTERSDPARIADLSARDWGLFRTLELNF
jgi:hypothetical protein